MNPQSTPHIFLDSATTADKPHFIQTNQNKVLKVTKQTGNNKLKEDGF